MRKKKNEPLPGYKSADEEIKRAIFLATIESRVLLQMLRETRKIVRDANRHGATANYDQGVTEYLCKGVAGNLQRLTRQVNQARRAALGFLESDQVRG